ncbi:MAG TPA: tyrosine-type recombinase/integrase [Cyclobacteriaceae bacterium]|nr:tyrosine-type recombinase/integrase [Cyclobacteriaceae bacterium]
MSKQIVYKSVFAPYFNSFLQMKEQMGFTRTGFANTFKELDRFFVATRATEPHITREQITAWSETRINDKARTLYDKHSIMRQFCHYMCHLGYECYIHRLPRQNWPPFIPYIFSHIQMECIFQAADKLMLPNRCMTSVLIVIPCLIRLLYSTGMRIGEALSLQNEDVDLMRKRILLKQTKNQVERLLPICPSLLEVLEQYKTYRNRMPVKGVSSPEAFFFVSTVGNPVSMSSVRHRFREILAQCGIPRRSDGQGPRIHDVRHTTAVHSLIKMVKSGMDIYCAMPILSVFLGHKSLKGTETYVRLTSEMYPEVLKMESPITSFVFPSNPYIQIDHGND